VRQASGGDGLSSNIARMLRHALERGARIEIEGLGTFVPGGKRGVRFVGQSKPRIFIAYVEEDLGIVKKLYQSFEQHGFRPWLDKKKLLPGQNWPRAIESAIQTADFFVACFSRRAVSKRGSFQSELRFALNCALKVPLDEIFFIPLRLDDCDVPRRIARQVQYVDLFPEWEAGLSRVIAVIRAQIQGRKRTCLPARGTAFL
jgi:TIR domain